MKLVLTGMGRMGRMIEELSLERGHSIVAGIDMENAEQLKTLARADAVLDFSAPTMLKLTGEYVRRTGTPLLSGTTGGGAEFLEELAELSAFAPVLHSANYSLGVAVLKELAAMAARSLPGYDIEIIETHHNKKADAPSGTAKLLADAVDPSGKLPRVYGREGIAPRGNEIGIHAIRGGTVAGQHEVSFFGTDETVTLSHSAASRRVFATGALTAVEKLVKLPNGLYQLRQVLFAAE